MRTRWPRTALLLALAAVLGGNVWLAGSALLPLTGTGPPEYLFFPASLWVFSVSTAGAALILAAVSRAAGRGDSASGLACLTPLVLLALPLPAVAMLATPAAAAAGPWLYLGLDLRGWLAGVAALLVLQAIDDRHARRLSLALRRWWWAARDRLPGPWKEALMALVLLGFAIGSSPPMRLAATPIGDEPKYLRYLENWYRGRGLDIDGLGPIADLPPGSAPQVGRNFVQLAATVRTVAADVAADLGRLAGQDRGPRAQAAGLGDWFVEGRHGGVYQVHPPGLPLLLFPGYYLDRAWLSTTSDFHPQLPSYLYATSAMLLLLWVAWGVALYRFLRRITAGDGLAFLLAGAAMLSLPAAAFNYQFYPEAAAGLLIVVLAGFVAHRSAAASGRSALWHGLLAGYLPWLHVRFAAVTLVVVASVVAAGRDRRRQVAWFLAGAALPLTALAIYDYYLTGGIWPWTLHLLDPDAPAFSTARIPHDLLGFWIDRDWGLVAHAPVYALALPGLWLLWRWRRREAIVIAALVLALAVPAAFHGWKGGATTPLRLVAAVLPLLMAALAEAIERYGRSRAFAVAFALLLVLSVHNGFSYNAHHYRHVPQLAAPSVSGWKTPLLLPSIDRPDWGRDGPFWIWIGLTGAGLLAPLARRRRARPQRSGPWPWTVVVAAQIAALGLAGTAVGVFTGDRVRADYLDEPDVARARVMRAFLDRGMDDAWSFARGRVEGRAIVPQERITRLDLTASPAVALPGEPVTLRIRVEDAAGRAAWGRAFVECSDGTSRTLGWVMDGAQATVVWQRPATYTCLIDFDPPGGAPLRRAATITVR